MKTTIYLTILFSLIFLTSCEKENDKTDSPTVKKTIHFDGKTDSLKVKKIIYSDCLDDSKNSVSTLSCVTLQAIAGNHLQIQRQTMFCCGTEKVDISVETPPPASNGIKPGHLLRCFPARPELVYFYWGQSVF
jgi:PBP1b-binding outer membrane lipoprotein LpoB